MTAFEQLVSWAADAGHEIMFGVSVGDNPWRVSRLAGNEARGIANISKNPANSAHLKTVDGVSFVTIVGRLQAQPALAYRAVIARADSFQ